MDQVNSIMHEARKLYEAKTQGSSASSFVYADVKCALEAERLRSIGNRLFDHGRYDQAAHSYTASIAVVPDESDELYETYFLRAEAMYRGREFRASLLDNNRARKGNALSQSMINHLDKRKLECLAQRRKADPSKIKSVPCKSYAEDPVQMAGLTSENITIQSSLTHVFVGADPGPVPNSSSKIKLTTDDSGNILMTASEDIQTGDLLLLENAFVVALGPMKRYKHCSHCFVEAAVPIPCPSCTRIMYCSTFCREKEYDSYHKIECQIIQFYNRFETPCEVAAIRAFIVGTERGNRFPELMQKLPLTKVLAREINTIEDLPLDDNYLLLLKSLRFHTKGLDAEGWAHVLEDSLAIAVDLVIALKKIEFFKPNDDEPSSQVEDLLSETEFYAIFLLMNHFISMKRDQSTVLYENQLALTNPVGVGMFPLREYFSHSCNPNLGVISEKTYQNLFAMRPIKAGEPVTYGILHWFARQRLEDRTTILAEFGHICSCEACALKWPVVTELENTEIRFVNKKAKKRLLRVLEDMNNRKNLASSTLTNDHILRMAREVLEALHSCLQRPSFDIVLFERLVVESTNKTLTSIHYTLKDCKAGFQKTFATVSWRITHA